MHFDIVEAIRQKQREHVRNISIDNGDTVDITINNGTVLISRGTAVERAQQENEGPADPVSPD